MGIDFEDWDFLCRLNRPWSFFNGFKDLRLVWWYFDKGSLKESVKFYFLMKAFLSVQQVSFKMFSLNIVHWHDK